MSFYYDKSTMKSLEEDFLSLCEEKLLKYYKSKLHYFSNSNEDENTFYSQHFIQMLKTGKCKNEVFTNVDGDSKDSIIMPNTFQLEGRNDALVYGMLLPSQFQPWFRFMDPMVEIEMDGTLKQNYKSISQGDRLYIWVSLNKKGEGEHLSAVVVTRDNKHLAFGMGFDFTELKNPVIYESYFSMRPIMEAISMGSSENVYEARVFSTDQIIENQLLRQLTKPDFRGLKLIAAAELSRDYVKYINEEFDKITFDNVAFQVIPRVVPTNIFNHLMVDELKEEFKSNIEKDLKSITPKIKSKTTSEFITSFSVFSTKTNYFLNNLVLLENGYITLLYPTYTINIPSSAHIYCKYSGVKTGRASNCTSFLQKIFGDLLNCGWFDSVFLNTDMIVSNPAWCRQNYDVARVPDCSKTIKREKLTMQELQEKTKRKINTDESHEKEIKLSFNDETLYTYLNTLSPKQLAKLILSSEKHKRRFRKFLN
uniref:Uncharacterized protein n=1 Tax=viral metagenome TaxID=1070528 RepID=A0A6C0KTP5_9ZZZZ